MTTQYSVLSTKQRPQEFDTPAAAAKAFIAIDPTHSPVVFRSIDGGERSQIASTVPMGPEGKYTYVKVVGDSDPEFREAYAVDAGQVLSIDEVKEMAEKLNTNKPRFTDNEGEQPAPITAIEAPVIATPSEHVVVDKSDTPLVINTISEGIDLEQEIDESKPLRKEAVADNEVDTANILKNLQTKVDEIADIVRQPVSPANSTDAENDSVKKSAKVDSKEAEEVSDEPTPYVTPRHLEQHYLQVDGSFYYKDKKDTLAFEDLDSKLRTTSNDEKVAEHMVDVAVAKRWNSLNVTGTPEFRREVWLEAESRGVRVYGYQPSDLDRAVMEQRRNAKAGNEIQPLMAPELKSPGQDATKAQDNAIPEGDLPKRQANLGAVNADQDGPAEGPDAEPDFDLDEVPAYDAPPTNDRSGVLIEHGRAPYNFDPEEKDNYYVKYEDDSGSKHVVWGVDLGRAIEQSGAQPGDQISLENVGKRPVEVNAPVRDNEGKIIGHKPIITHRNQWDIQIERAAKFREGFDAEAAGKDPELAKAYKVMATAEGTAEKLKLSEPTREVFVAAVADRIANDLGNGVPLPNVKTVEVVRPGPTIDTGDSGKPLSRAR